MKRADSEADREAERLRYEQVGKNELKVASTGDLPVGGQDLAPEFRRPYEVFDQFIAQAVNTKSMVLEIGAGGGRHTVALTDAGAAVVALDVSEMSLRACRIRTEGAALPVVGSMEELPVVDRSIDVVVSAGSLSYGEPAIVNAEIFRVLKPGGSLLIVDSLNHNPIFRLNRWIHFRRGQRSKSTLMRMPTIHRMRTLAREFECVRVYFHGSYLILQPFLRGVLGAERALAVNDALESRLGSRRNAFKFVMDARGFKGSPETWVTTGTD